MNDRRPDAVNHSPPTAPGVRAKRKMLEIASIPDTNLVPIKYMDLRRGVGWGYIGNFDLPELTDIESYKIILGGSEGRDVEFDMPDFAFNRICDADSNEKTLEYASAIVTKNAIPVLNHPDAVIATKRDLIYQRFQGFKGIDVPRTVRIAPRYCGDVRRFIEDGGIDLPCIVRPAGGHDQVSMVLIENIDDTNELERFAFDGRDYYMIEFVDYRDADDLYRKFRVVYVDGALYPRHLFRGPHWIVGNGDKSERGDAAMAEEKDFLENFQARLGAETLGNLKAFGAAVGLDLFGMDLSLRPDGSLLLFEANACMGYFIDTGRRPYIKPYVDAIKAGVNRMVSDYSARLGGKTR